MKKFLALTVVAGSALGIAATTTACNNDQIKSQVELGLSAALGAETGAKCYDTFFDATGGVETESIESIDECVKSNISFIDPVDKDNVTKKLEFSNYKLVNNKDLTAEVSISVKATPRTGDVSTVDFSIHLEKKDGGSAWLIKTATPVAKP